MHPSHKSPSASVSVVDRLLEFALTARCGVTSTRFQLKVVAPMARRANVIQCTYTLAQHALYITQFGL
eukprot:5960820-Lingulodinium_polyedra.AAC.1